MPWGSVKVHGPANRDIYVNGNYGDVAGTTGGVFPVEYGENTFEALDSEWRIDLRAHATVNDTSPDVETTLQAVEPPEPTALTSSVDP